ncbi:MAG: hypothetical protein NUV94_03675 [Candidatus Acetothermia bacterium]|jgi:spoIIIJ-associated protein|nr:hypothetical protein [Candidatus Acetothermia bacterium]
MDAKTGEAIRQFFSGCLVVLGEPGQVEVTPEDGDVYVNLSGPFKLIPQGDSAFRAALSRVAQLHLRADLPQGVRIVVDINGEALARRHELEERARRVAERVVAERRRIQLEPMPPQDRRVIHLVLADFPGVRTYSVGKGSGRRVVIEPTQE